MVVQLDSGQQIEACGAGAVKQPFGFSKYTKANTLYATVVAEAVTLNGVVASNLKHANLFDSGGTPPVGSVKVANSVGAAYINGTDYTVNYVNGQITRIGGAGIADGETVYVTYQYQVTEQELKFEGRNFWNFLNDVDIQNGLITVITDWSIIFTTQYDPSQVYAVNDKLYCGDSTDGTEGLVTKDSGNVYIGNVFQVPTADDPFLGVRFVGGMTS
jgi:hypothetical protein